MCEKIKVADMPKGARFQILLFDQETYPGDAVYISTGYVHPHTNRLRAIDQYGHPRYLHGEGKGRLVPNSK